MALAVGSRLGPYEILTPMGADGMGKVYRAKAHFPDRVPLRERKKYGEHPCGSRPRFEVRPSGG